MAHFKTIVTGHGKFATGMQGAVELLAGKQETLTFIDFEETMSDGDLAEKLQDAVGDTPALIFADLVGGTPYKEAAKIAFKRPDVKVVGGCNLASLLETLFSDFDSLPDCANSLVATTKRSAQVLDLSMDSEDERPSDDGI
ncbi:EIIAB-Man [Lacticaseibacillus paracasei]|jgi:PTS system N-acetylgalactosamine-specific IIA component|uniref:PTS sugar transporter subunit IIA n=1 Tax=Lacticaseibacillus paracasei TaxID=1597 RepID=UPI000398E61B|nr:PTS sugar transporter subunit IIA [Lacticaseibacillus paracasei]ETW68703.1 PTS sugar transporter [Lacticaseibacillus rhamnosus 2166]OAU51751.1 PTS sugar transporter [Lacticaseibacillus rhamnosus]MCU6431608.1 PTS sugar transporter subunit IIA [Lacticaseibacillus paracasei]RND60301.1 EIIAB-Man [Lacticaseibacillus paracasei]RND72813.1 EIIAB-Man [Lacticaseibacillus paracasei]